MKPSNAGAALAAMRKTFSGGNTTVLRPCPFCRVKFGARKLRAHQPHCPSKPKGKSKLA